jgi:hypothetical protein
MQADTLTISFHIRAIGICSEIKQIGRTFVHGTIQKKLPMKVGGAIKEGGGDEKRQMGKR